MKRLNRILDYWPQVLLAIFVMALLIRVAFVLFLQDGFYFPDSISYTRAASNLLTRGEFGEAYRRAPGYAVFLAAIQTVLGNSILTVRLTESVLGALLAVVIAVLGRRVGGPAVGALAGTLWSVYPMGVFIVGLVYPTSLMTLVLACGALCVLPEARQALSSKGVFVGGVLWGIGTLVVPAGLATIGLMSLWLLYWGGAKRLALVALLLLGSAIALAPWTVRNYYVYGRVVAVDARMENHLARTTDPADDPDTDKFAVIVRHPALFAVNAAREFVYFWRLYPERLGMAGRSAKERYYPDHRMIRMSAFSSGALTTIVSVASTAPLFIFSAIGTWAMWFRKERRRDLSLLWTLILSFAIGYSLFFTKIRYRVPIEPYLVILGAYGLAQTWTAFSGNTWLRPVLHTKESTTVEA
jgi:4-amino-4-deoxy-L-arabinose transferase-like glycosyltransferase